MLLEVLVSAVIVALIAAGTYTGLAASGSATAHERGSAQAVVIAQGDEERLRGLSIEKLAQLGQTTYSVTEDGQCVEEKPGGWYYYSGESQWQTGCEAEADRGKAYSGTVYTITSKAEYVSKESETVTCESESGEANYIKTTSTVSWSSIGSHEPVKQSSLVDEPSTATLEVKVKNRNNEPVSGATVEAFDPTSASKATVTETTPASGCVVIGALEEGEVKLIASREEWVTRNGKTAPEKLTSVKKGSLAEAELTLERPGSISAKFTGPSPQYEAAQGFTFVAYQSEIASSAPLFVGGEANTPTATATLASLFPFALPVNKPDKYTIYAGDCEANEPVQATKGSGSEITASEVPAVQAEPGKVESEQIPLPKAEITVYEGASSPSAKLSSASAKIINGECKGKAAQNYTSGVPYEHVITLTNGELETQYLPYAKKLELCVVGKVSGKYYRHYFPFANTKKTGVKESLYLKSSGYTESSSSISC